jgi:hypothetical protein
MDKVLCKAFGEILSTDCFVVEHCLERGRHSSFHLTFKS